MSLLKYWFGSAQWTDYAPTWDNMVIAAYSERDAIELYVQVGGTRRGATSHVRSFMHKAKGDRHDDLYSSCGSRGVYFFDRNGKSRTFIEPESRTILDEAPPEAQEAAAKQPIPDGYGRLFVGFDKGRQIDVWKFQSSHGDRAVADQMTAEVRMRPAEHGGRRFTAGERGGIEFVATSKCWDGEEVSANINTLFKKVSERFKTFELGKRGIVWESWLEVVIEPESGYNSYDAENGLRVAYKRLKRGVDPRDGVAYTLLDNGSGSVYPFPEPKVAGEKDEGEFGARSDEAQYAYIPETPENLAALDAIIAKLAELRTRLAGLLEQKVIAAKLSGVAGLLRIEEKG